MTQKDLKKDGPEDPAMGTLSRTGSNPSPSGDSAGGEVWDILSNVEAQFEQLRELQRAQQDRNEGLSEREQDLTEREAELQAKQDQLDARQEDLDATQSDVQDRELGVDAREKELDELEASGGAASEADMGKIQSLEEELARVKAAQDGLQTELTDAQVTNDSLRGELEQARSGDEEDLEEAQKRIAELETQVEAGAKRGADQKGIEELRAKAQGLAAFRDHLQLRRDRLGRAHKLVQEKLKARPASPAPARRSHEELERHAAQVRQIEHQRHELSELKRMLAHKERQMIRKWARPRAIMSVVWIFVLAGIAAGVSLFAADHFFPAIRSASVVLVPKSEQRGKLADEEAVRWQYWHTDLLAEKTFWSKLAKRMDERRIEAYDTVGSVSERLASDLTIDTHVPTEITLTLAGTDPAEITAFLDILASTIALESRNQLRKRSDSAWAEVKGARKVKGRVKYSLINSTPIKDDRLKYAGPIFGVAFAAILLFVGVIYLRLIRAKRVFDESDELGDDETAGQTMYTPTFPAAQ